MVSEARRKKFCSHSCAAKFYNPDPGLFFCKTCSKQTERYRQYCDDCLQILRAEQGKEKLQKAGLIDGPASSKRRLKQLQHEEAEATKLRNVGYEVFSPTVVCDRVAVKDGKVFFVEFKKLGQKLRPGQQRIRDLVPESYIIQYSE
jgi:hypothetical protein